MSNAQDIEHPSFPVHVHDGSEVSEPEPVGFDRAEAPQVAGGAHGHRLELVGDPSPDGPVQIAELLGREVREFNSECQALIPRS